MGCILLFQVVSGHGGLAENTLLLDCANFNWIVNILTALHMIGRTQVTERLSDMTLNRMLLDVTVSAKKEKRYHKHPILIRLCY